MPLVFLIALRKRLKRAFIFFAVAAIMWTIARVTIGVYAIDAMLFIAAEAAESLSLPDFFTPMF